MINRNKKGIIYGTLAAISYGTNPLFALYLYTGGIGVNSVLFYRYAIAVLLYGFWLKLVNKKTLKIPKESILPLFILGLLFSGSSLALFASFKYIDAGIACTILFIYPVMVAFIMHIFFNEKTNKTTIFSLILTSIGICLLYKGPNNVPISLKGIMIVLLSALLYALYIIGVKNIKPIKHIKSNVLSFYVMLFGLFLYIFNLKFCMELQIINSPFLWACAIGLAIIPTIISIETITLSIKLIGATKTALLGSLEPITALFFGITLFNQHLNFRIFLGIILILFGVSLTILRQKIKAYFNNIDKKTNLWVL